MEDNIVTNHCYEQDNSSGMLVYSVDNCKPSFIRFTAKINIKVILDHGSGFGNQISGKDYEIDINNCDSYVNDKNDIQNKSCEILELLSDSVQENYENIETESAVNEVSSHSYFCDNSLQSDEDTLMVSTKEKVFDSGKEDGLLNYTEPQNVLHKDNISKYNLRHKLSVIDKANMKREQEALDLSLNNGSVEFNSNKMTDRGNSSRVQQRKKNVSQATLSGKVLENSSSQRTKRRGKTIRDKIKKVELKKIKTCKQNETKGGNISESLDTDKSENPMKKATRKKSDNRPRKLLIENDVTCDFCGVVFGNKLGFFNHRRIKGSSFKCQICGKDEPFEAYLMVHMLSHDEPEKVYADVDSLFDDNVNKRRLKIKCNVCGLIVSSIDSLKIHMILHTKECLYQCCICGDQKFFSLSSLRHHQDVHRVSKRMQCGKCGQRFASRTELFKHSLSHEIKCGICGEVFPNKTSRTCHYRMAHPHDIKKCHECFNLFSTDDELQKHILYHRSHKKEQCPECGLVVTRLKDHMIIHLRKEGDELFACDQCPMKYKRKSSLNKHLLVHSGEKPYACHKCPKKFRVNSVLMKHLLTHTSERPFVCEVCGKQFSIRSNLVTHTKIHLDRKFSCSQCAQTFNYKISLHSHMKSKHNLPDISSINTCPHCSENFEDESSLNGHMITAHLEPEADNDKQMQQMHTLPFTTGQELTHITQDIPMSVMADPQQSHAPDLHVSTQNSLQTLLGFDKPVLLESTHNFPSQSSMTHHDNTQLSSNVDLYERSEMLSYFPQERTSPLTLTHQSSALTLPPGFHFMSSSTSSLEHSIHSIDVNNVPMINAVNNVPMINAVETTVSETNHLNEYGNRLDFS